MSTPARTRQEILRDELKRLAWHLDQAVIQYGQPDWSVDEFLENLGDLAEQLRTLSGHAAHTPLIAPEARATEVRLNPDQSLDEVVGHGYGHLEQMDFNHWWLQIGDVAVWLQAKGAIRATYERRSDVSTPQSNEAPK